MDFRIDRWPGDGPTVVLLHAGVADRRSWDGVARELPALDVIAYDRRGFGETPLPEDEFSHLTDLFTVLDEVVPERPVTLVGSSMGGGLALDAALTQPERVTGLVLISPAISGAPEPTERDFDAAALELFAAMEVAEQDEDLDTLNRLEVRLWLDGPNAPEGRVGGDARDLALDMNRIALEHGASDEDGASGVDAWARLHEITAPATVTWGDLDIAFAIDRTRHLAEHLRSVRATHIFQSTAHLPYLERPAEVAAVVRAAVSD